MANLQHWKAGNGPAGYKARYYFACMMRLDVLSSRHFVQKVNHSISPWPYTTKVQGRLHAETLVNKQVTFTETSSRISSIEVAMVVSGCMPRLLSTNELLSLTLPAGYKLAWKKLKAACQRLVQPVRTVTSSRIDSTNDRIAFTDTSGRQNSIEVAIWLHAETFISQSIVFTDTWK